MREKIKRSLLNSYEEAAVIVKERVSEIERKAKRAVDTSQFFLDEINRLVDYGSSEIGKRYIAEGFVEFEDTKALVNYMADYYEGRIEWWLERCAMRGNEPDENNVLSDFMEDADKFFLNYLLEQSCLRLTNKTPDYDIPKERRSDFLFNFNHNEKSAKSFLKGLYDKKNKGERIKPNDVFCAYQVNLGKRYINTGNDPKANLSALYDVIGNKKEYSLNLVSFAYSSLTKTFRNKNY